MAAAAVGAEQRWPRLAEQLLAHEPIGASGIERPLMLSGAADGADTCFAQCALSAGHDVVHFLGPRNRPSKTAATQQAHCLYRLDDELLEGEVINEVFERILPCMASGEDVDAVRATWRDSRRNFLQVCEAQAVYAVGYRERGREVRCGLDIGGGTGWACQFYLDRFVGESRNCGTPGRCNLFFFDDGSPEVPSCLIDSSTFRGWSRWHLDDESWEPLAGLPPRPNNLYAGIGASMLSPHGIAAIHELFAT